jgi:hypothetical protein
MGKHSQSIDRQILGRMRSGKKSLVFSATDFLDLGSRPAVDQALSRNSRLGLIRRVARGLYDVPRKDPVLGVLSPQSDAIARALAKRDAARLQASGAVAANSLGLTDQVPTRMVYLTDGRAHRVQVGMSQVVLRKATPRQLATAGRISGDVIQALRWLGRDHVDESAIDHLRRLLTIDQKAQLLRDLRFAPAWVADIMCWVVKMENLGKP